MKLIQGTVRVMVTISLCMIVKDEEEVLRQCMDSVKDLVDKIIIVDNLVILMRDIR